MRSLVAGLGSALVLAAAATPAAAQDVTFPIVGTETKRGTGATTPLATQAPSAKIIDGLFGDWIGSATGFGGASVRSHGELIYTDHLFDAYGADDGGDVERLNTLAPAHDTVPETYRLEALAQQDPAGEFGVPVPEQFRYSTNYGDLEHVDVADLSEVRLAYGTDGLHVLARTTTMKAATDTAVLVLLDTHPDDGRKRKVPFAEGLTTTRAERAYVLAGNRGWTADVATGTVDPLPAGRVATRPDGYGNVVEARLDVIKAPKPSVVVAAGRQNAAGNAVQKVANVAFRSEEPVREWFDKHQALALHAGTIDPFFTVVDTAALSAGATERYTPGPGYHERIFRSTEAISSEDGENGVLQHYGLYLPDAFDPSAQSPLQLWLHWRGGTAHSAGAAIPGMFRDLGDRPDAVVVSPRGRGSSSWYVGKGHVDVQQVWDDVHALVRVDPNRRYVSGHSMGGWGSFLMTITHPDWFAAALPASPPVTQGAWTGLDFPGCDDMRYDEYTPCYVEANGGDARAQHTRRLLENLRHIPIAIQHGTADELVPTSGILRQAERFVQLGYRHRTYLFHTQEHYGPPVWDQWGEGGRYMHQFRRPSRPAQITHVRDMAFERAIERGVLDLDLGRNRWLKGLETDGRASFDGRTFAFTEKPYTLVPEAGGPASTDQTGPYTMTGLRWQDTPLATLPAARNGFEATVNGARSVTLDAAEMGLDTARPITARITTDAPLVLNLLGEGTRTLAPGTHDLTFG
ncbi:MAG: alpha/beta hydrolase-fold protein [Actinomycetota bacterium]|nr:alpha/beta hydrolase-fold protein [Actinomycetota bacterium]